MCGILGCGIGATILGGALIIVSCVVSFVVLPNIVEETIISETVLRNDTIQLERFAVVPFPLNFTVRIFNLSNPEEYLGGDVPILNEIGPYVYKLYQTREISDMEEDTISYHRLERFVFDAEASFPLTENDNVTIVNVPYHAIIQVAQTLYPELLNIFNAALPAIYGPYNSPVITLPVQDLLFNGIELCLGGGAGAVGQLACNLIRNIGANAQNLEELEDGSLRFSVLNYKQEKPSLEFKVFRGLNDHRQLGEIITFNSSSYLPYWPNAPTTEVENQNSVCNMVNGTDSAIYAPFVNRAESLYAINTDVCRSVELRYESDTEYEGIPTVRFVANEWFLDNDEECFCLGVTEGINRDNGCLLRGAMELYSCVGAYLVLSYPHFLFADQRYQLGVVGLNPNEEEHKIFLDIEPHTGTPVKGFKRAQFNIFSRQVTGISATSSLTTALVPVLWIEEGIALPEDLVDEIKTKLLSQLRLVDIIVPIIITISCVIFVIGIVLIIIAKCRKPSGVDLKNS